MKIRVASKAGGRHADEAMYTGKRYTELHIRSPPGLDMAEYVRSRISEWSLNGYDYVYSCMRTYTCASGRCGW